MILVVLSGLGSCAIAVAQSPVPSDSDVQSATKLVSDAYKNDYEAAKSLAQKRALSGKIIADADKTLDDKTSAFAMYTVAQKIAVGIGDVDTAMRAEERIAQRFQVDASAQKRKILAALADSAKTPLDQANLTRYIGLALHPFVKQNKFDEVAGLLDLAVNAAKKSKEADLQKYWAWKELQLKAQAKAWAATRIALSKLEVSPADAEASGIAGQYRAFWEEDWDAAIPLLALSEEKPWQELAERELKGAETQADKLALADAWYEAGVKANASPTKEAVLRHAGAQYERLLTALTALTKRRVENRLAEIRDVASSLPKDIWVEVLDLVDVRKHVIEGTWEREGLNVVYHDPNHCKSFYVPVLAEGAYELRIRAARTSAGGDAMFVTLSRSVNGCGFALNGYNGMDSGFQNIDKRGANDNETRTAPVPLMSGQPYQLLLQVEPKDDKATLSALLNNRPYVRWTGQRERLSFGPEAHRERIVLQACHSTIEVYSVQIKRRSGPAWITD